MAKKIEFIDWPDAPDVYLPYTPVVKASGGTMAFIAGVTAAPVYHSHPHRPEEFEDMPLDTEGQARATMENLKKSLASVGATFADVVMANLFFTDHLQMADFIKVWRGYMGEHRPATTTVQVMRLATDPRCLLEINAIAVID